MNEVRLLQIDLEIAKELMRGLAGIGCSLERIEQLEDEKCKLQSNDESKGET